MIYSVGLVLCVQASTHCWLLPPPVTNMVCNWALLWCMSITSVKTTTKSNLRKWFIWHIYPNHSASLCKVKAGTQAGTEARNMKERFLLGYFQAHIQLLFLDHLSRDSTTHSRLHHPISTTIQKMPPKHAYRPIWWKPFLSWGSLLPGNSSFIKLIKQRSIKTMSSLRLFYSYLFILHPIVIWSLLRLGINYRTFIDISMKMFLGVWLRYVKCVSHGRKHKDGNIVFSSEHSMAFSLCLQQFSAVFIALSPWVLKKGWLYISASETLRQEDCKFKSLLHFIITFCHETK